jgi:ankyrin repeat protein
MSNNLHNALINAKHVIDSGEVHYLKDLLKQHTGLATALTLAIPEGTLLHYAALRGKTVALDLLLNQKGVNANVRNSQGETPLHLAARNIAALELLFAYGADINVRNNMGENALNYVANYSIQYKTIYEDAISSFIQHGIETTISNNGSTISIADNIRNLGYDDIAKTIETAIHNCNAKDAILSNDVATLKKLLNNNLVHGNARIDGIPLLHTATAGGKEEIVSLLLQHGAEVNAKEQTHLTHMGRGGTALHISTYYPPILKILLEEGANPFISDNQGNLPLAMAQMHRRELIQPLETAMALPEFALDAAEYYRIQHEKVINKKNPKDIEIPVDIIKNALSQDDPIELRNLLRSYPHLVDMILPEDTLIHYTAKHGTIAAMSTLLERGANINRRNIGNETPLHAAIPRVDMVNFLLAHGVDLEATTKRGETAFHYAASYWVDKEPCPEVIKCLIQNGCDITYEGIHVIATAHKLGKNDLAECIEEAVNLRERIELKKESEPTQEQNAKEKKAAPTTYPWSSSEHIRNNHSSDTNFVSRGGRQ